MDPVSVVRIVAAVLLVVVAVILIKHRRARLNK